MKFISVLTFLIGATAYAETTGIFNDDKVVVLVQGNDSDAKKLFDTLTAASTEQKGKMKKEYNVTSSSGDTLFSILCSWAPLANVSSCTLTFNKWNVAPVSVTINNSSPKYVILESGNKYYAEDILKNFTPATYPSDLIYSSENRQLKIWAFINHLGKAEKFGIQYDDN